MVKKLLQINVTANSGSTGRIAEGIGKQAMANGWQSFIAYGRKAMPSESQLIQIGSRKDHLVHGVFSRVFDNHGLMSQKATKTFIKQIDNIQPEIIHLHNIHGYYLNYPLLFEYLSACKSKVVWTLHDCWGFTGHCSYFDYIGCNKWLTECNNCPQKKSYPASFIFDRSRKNFQDKKHYFLLPEKIHLLPVSNWLKDLAKRSFLGDYPVDVIHNGINLDVFYPRSTEGIRKKYNCSGKKVLLGVAGVWDNRKGLDDLIKISEKMPSNVTLMLVGLSAKQIDLVSSRKNIIPIAHTESIDELAEIYSMADVFLNPTYEDTYPTTNLEAISCGTPVVTYKTGGSCESVTIPEAGKVVSKGDMDKMLQAALACNKNTKKCREYAIDNFDEKICFQKYIDLYEENY